LRHAFRIALIAAAAAGFSAAAIAQEIAAPPKIPDATKSVYIAMLYEKIRHPQNTPDFEDWVRQTPDYNDAQLVDRPALVLKESKELKNTYDLMTPSEPITIVIKAHISGYSATEQGFLVTNFQKLTYFDYAYSGERYALVPNGISSYQWLKAVPEEVKEIMKESDNGKSANLVLSLVPTQIDPKPMALDGKKHKLMMADISKIEMWSKDGTHVIWDDKMNAPTSERSKVLDLFQH
jgi:hypothetical protein